MFFTARFARDAERKYVFFSAERAEKKKPTAWWQPEQSQAHDAQM
jgi:hypothetical protein